MNDEQYGWVGQDDFLKIKLNQAGYDLPGNVLSEVFRELSLMVPNSENPHMEGLDANQVAAGFECSRVEIGFTPEEVDEMKDYYEADVWPNVQGGEPVAVWNSGMSIGCTSAMFIMPDGSFEWTAP